MKHDKLREQYEAERSVNPEAWKNWLFRHNLMQPWMELNDHPKWDEGTDYRRSQYAPPFIPQAKEVKYADLAIQYWTAVKTNPNEWKNWEMECECGWVQCSSPPLFLPDINYRRKPETINVNGFEVPKPLENLDGLGDFDSIYFPLPSNHFYYHWHHAKTAATYLNLKRGLAHKTKEAAIAHAKAMLGIDPKA